MARRSYIDHASCAPLRPSSAEAMHAAIDISAADPGRLHEEAQLPRGLIEQAREQVAAFAGVRPRQVIFTASATEARVTAIRSAVHPHGAGARVVMSAVEHSSVIRTLEQCGAEVVVVPCDSDGVVAAAEYERHVDAATALVVLQHANHEVGTIQEVHALIELCSGYGVPMLVDAAASAEYLAPPAAPFVSLSSSALGGPPGVGALILGRGQRVTPLFAGAAQERGRRAGLENLVGIVGFGAAVAEVMTTGRDVVAARVGKLRDQFEGGLAARDDVQILARSVPRLPHLTSCVVEGIEAEPLLLALDRLGVALHSGSSCSSEMLEPSAVLAAMHAPSQHALCWSFGWSTTSEHVEHALGALHSAIEQLRALRS